MVDVGVTLGHRKSLEMLRQAASVQSTLAMYRDAFGQHEVFLRPTDNGLTVLSLDRSAPKFVHAGHLKTIPPEPGFVASKVAVYQTEFDGALANPKPEEQFSLSLLRSALADGLRLPNSDLLLVGHEWRFPTSVGGMRLDLLALDSTSCGLVVIELKQDLGSTSDAADQASGYVDLLGDFPDLAPFFGDLFDAMKAIYATGRELDGVRLDASIPPRAEVWTPVDRIRVPAAESSPAEASPLGPQNSGDGVFAAQMRRHQSWWRAERLEVPWGTGPTKGLTRELGNMLQTPAADKGLNFLTAGIHATARHRIAEGAGVEPFRCTHNLLSSQPMCFNLFGPLVDDPQLALMMLQPLLPVTATEITGVRIEYAPAPASEYLNDRTAFDAFIEFRDEGGELAFVGVETKLTEPFSQKSPDTPRYRALTEVEGSPWTGSPPELADKRWNQLWRNQLLVQATRSHPSRLHGSRGWLAVVAHPEDPHIKDTTADYRKFLSDQDSVLEWPIDAVIAAFRSAASTPADHTWLDDFEDRYLNLALSDHGA